MASPFDLRTVLLAKHAQHVVLIHFPIALFLTGFAFDLTAGWRRSSSFGTVAYYNVILAGITVIPTVLTGLLAWRWELGGRRLHGVLLMHLSCALAAAVLILVSAYLHWLDRADPGSERRTRRLPVEFAATVLVTAAAHLGGFVSGVNGTF